MIKAFRLVFILCVFILLTGFDLQNPVLFDKGKSPRTIEERDASYIVYDSVKEAGGSANRLLSTTNLGQGNNWYAFSKNMVIYNVDISQSQVAGTWPLTRWSHQTYSSNIQNTHGTLGEVYPPSDSYSGVGLSLGCLGNAPLRYGDLESDGTNELIIFNGMFTLFSPHYQRTVFAAYLTESDWVTPEDATRKFDEGVPGKHQYVSGFLTDNNGVGPAIRSYSKLYFGLYDGDAHPDIVIWRKEYRSNLKTDSTQGFTKIDDAVFHYELDLTAQQTSDAGVTGEYLPQASSEASIRGWLNSNNLNWAAGYPSTSECAGQEGQLIPEMHDPLLNDPDVLIPVPVVTP